MRGTIGGRLKAWLARLLGLATPRGARRGRRGAKMILLAGQPTTAEARGRARQRLGADPARHLAFVRPQETDPQISRYLQDHIVITYPAQPGDHLVVFFPGTFAFPVGFMTVLDTAARLGGRAIGLDYVDAGAPGASTIKQLSGGDPRLAGAVRSARVFGGQEPGGAAIAPADGIVSRLVALLRFLHTKHPNAGWERFIDVAEPRWDRLILAGHSQGAGMAAFLARKYRVARVALLSGGADGDPHTREPADWVTAPSATPSDRWFAMVHAHEPNAAATLLGLEALGVPGPAKPWHGTRPMASSHIAIVDDPPRTRSTHESTAADMATPLAADGTPAFRPVWRFLLSGQ